MKVECKSEVISLKTKKFFVGATVSLALLINPLQVSADDVETFGDEFEDNGSEVVPFQEENEDLGAVLVFNNPAEKNSNTESEKVKENPKVTINEDENAVVVKPTPKRAEREKVLPPSKNPSYTRDSKSNKNLHEKSKRFVKVAMDDTYIYYLDKQSISWKRLPYSASEYMLDFWVRMIERNPDTSKLSAELADYVNDGFNGEIEVAAERGLAFTQSDIEVLKHRKFFLEHYYIRPKTKQIQFLCELEVIGHPQNTVSEREYAPKNWENLIPGSIESMIYNTTIKEVHKSKADAKGHMSVADMFDEYLRISIR